MKTAICVVVGVVGSLACAALQLADIRFDGFSLSLVGSAFASLSAVGVGAIIVTHLIEKGRFERKRAEGRADAAARRAQYDRTAALRDRRHLDDLERALAA